MRKPDWHPVSLSDASEVIQESEGINENVVTKAISGIPE